MRAAISGSRASVGLLASLLALGLTLGGTTTANATSIIEFYGSAGTLSQEDAGTPVTSDDYITVTGSTITGGDAVTPINSGNFTCSSCVISLRTGTLTSGPTVDGSTTVWGYGSGGNITLNGTIGSVSGILLSGGISRATYSTSGANNTTLEAVLDASLSQELASYFGVSTEGDSGLARITFKYSQTGVAKSLGITFDAAAVPVPAALPLFGSALLGLTFVGFRRKRDA